MPVIRSSIVFGRSVIATVSASQIARDSTEFAHESDDAPHQWARQTGGEIGDGGAFTNLAEGLAAPAGDDLDVAARLALGQGAVVLVIRPAQRVKLDLAPPRVRLGQA